MTAPGSRQRVGTVPCRAARSLRLACLLAVLGASNVFAQSFWEAGIGLSAVHLPDYRGSDEAHGYLLPFPYFVYRGERLRVDRGGIVARLFDSERVELDASFTGNLSLRSGGNRARAGMPELDPLGEIGPELVVRLVGDRRKRESELSFRLAARAAFALEDGGLSHKGWTASPYLALHLPDAWGSGLDVNASLGLLYGDSRYHDYFYSVAPQFATATRPAYDAPGGYAGIQSQLSFGRRCGSFWFGGFLRMDSLRGASALEDSPLVRSRSYVAGGFGVAWIFAGSR